MVQADKILRYLKRYKKVLKSSLTRQKFWIISVYILLDVIFKYGKAKPWASRQSEVSAFHHFCR